MTAFNRSRADSPLDPCPLCLEELSRNQLLALVKDLREQLSDVRDRLAQLSLNGRDYGHGY